MELSTPASSWSERLRARLAGSTLSGGDASGDGMSNLQEYLAGTDPADSASFFGITGVVPEGADIRVTWATADGKTNALQSSAVIAVGFADIFTVTNTVSTTTNYLDVGAVTNS